MGFSEKDVDYVSKLARIRLSDDDKKKFAAQLEHILEYVNKLNELNTDDVEPTAHILPISNVMREDILIASADSEMAVKQSPSLTDNLYNVPKVIE